MRSEKDCIKALQRKRIKGTKENNMSVLKSISEKITDSRGFTLTETLSTIIIMSMVGIMVATGMATMARVHRQMTEYEEAQMLLVNTLTLLKDKLIYAKPDSETFSVESGTLTFEHASEGIIRLNTVSEGTGGLAISYKKDGGFTAPQPLVGYQKKEDIFTDWNVTYDDDHFDIDLSVKKKENASIIELVGIEHIKIVPVNA